ncbi:carbohydrate esterase family 12 protein [Amanita thiersii Skay4041]|uniref:Carbohydrate esterase family 12 protein n=1 Tax=Amanita thiersii Skay4041 TaxID=703135 RepID=A0A2A9NPS3_9AGAR|nr:carbohydrate esterase family 12 protein [Amanita thiersii Skay4041]
MILAWCALGQTVYLAGDSTMALGGGGSGTQGWGVFLPQFLTIPVVNDAIGGESARSFSDEGRFTNLVSSVRRGDFVIIEFGHNDATSGAIDNGKQDAVGDGYNITSIVTTANGTQILIHSFAFYIENAVDSLLQKGAVPIISSLTPDNIWSNGSIAPGGRFVTYAESIGLRRNITYINHFGYTAQAYNQLGQTTTTTFYPNDHLHTNSDGALVVAEAFVRGLLCSESLLRLKVNAGGQGVPNGCL